VTINPKHTLTRSDIAKRLQREINVPKYEADGLIDSVINIMTTTLANGESVKLYGFGNFIVRDQKPRLGRNPKTGEEVKIAARRVLAFRPSLKLQESVDSAIKTGQKDPSSDAEQNSKGVI